MKNKMFKLHISHFLDFVVTSLTERSGKLIGLVGNPYKELSKQAKEVARTLTYPRPSKWEYMIDTTTGLKLLKSEKDSEALDRVRQIADELFK